MKNREHIKLSAKGRYSLTVLDAAGDVVEKKCTRENNNVVLDQGAYAAFFSGDMFSNYVARLGTGTVELVESDTGLTNMVAGETSRASASRVGNETDNGDGTNTVTLVRTMPFSLGQMVGTFSEVGVAASSSGTFIAGQLIKDELGAATTITVLADEQLIVTYTLEWTYPNTTTVVGSGTVTDSSSNSYNYTIYAQPYFRDYTLNSKHTQTTVSTAGHIRFFESDLTRADSSELATGSSGSKDHDPVAKTVTRTSSTITLSPTDGTITDATWITAFAARSGGGIADASIGLINPMHYINKRGGGSVAIKFDTPFSKTSNDTFTFKFDLTWAY